MRARKYNHELLIQDYVSGLSLPKLREKYGINIGHASGIMRNAGVIRSISEAVLQSKSMQTEWHKLVIIKNYGRPTTTRLITIPGQLLRELGYNTKVALKGKWVVNNSQLMLVIKEGDKKNEFS